MKHLASPDFWKAYHRLSPATRKLADKNFQLLKTNSSHPSLHFKKVGRFRSVRVGIHYRAIAVEAGDDLVWFWIGPHAEYDQIVKQ